MAGQTPVSMTLMATAKKAAAKAPAKKAVKKPTPGGRPTLPPKGAGRPPAAPNETTGKTVKFVGRDLVVDMPDAGQLLIWRKIVRQIQNEQGTKDGERAFVLMERGLKIVESILPRAEDREFIDDVMLDKRADLQAVVGIIILAIKAYRPDVEIPDPSAPVIE